MPRAQQFVRKLLSKYQIKRQHLVSLWNTWRETEAYENSLQTFLWWKEYLRVNKAVVGLGLFVVLTNVVISQASATGPQISQDVLLSNPYDVAETLRLIDKYIPNNPAKPEDVAQALQNEITGSYIKTPFLPDTQPGQTDAPAAPSDSTQIAATPTPAAPPAVRTTSTKYTVQIGDTLSGIGSKFNLKISTIQVSNNITNIDSIKPGNELTIPVGDLPQAAIDAAKSRQVASTAAKTNASTLKNIGSAKGGSYGIIMPIHYILISRGVSSYHNGVDFAANIGSPVAAGLNCVVTIASPIGWNDGYGKTILLNCGNGTTIRYGHLSQINVSVGQHVGQGDIIALSGNTGRSTGPHLHFEVRVNGRVIDPFGFSG